MYSIEKERRFCQSFLGKIVDQYGPLEPINLDKNENNTNEFVSLPPSKATEEKGNKITIKALGLSTPIDPIKVSSISNHQNLIQSHFGIPIKNQKFVLLNGSSVNASSKELPKDESIVYVVDVDPVEMKKFIGSSSCGSSKSSGVGSSSSGSRSLAEVLDKLQARLISEFPGNESKISSIISEFKMF